MITFYVKPNNTASPFVMTTIEGEITTVRINWAAKTGNESTSVSTAVWTVDSGSATVASASETADVASASVTTASTGTSIIKVKATMADGQADIALIKVICTAIPTSTGDYE